MIKTVLIVNDSAVERAIASETLSESFVVFEAKSGEDAYRVMKNESIDIVFLDNVMVNETGYDVAKNIRENKDYDNIPLVLMTSDSSPIDEYEAFESGFNRYMHKSDMENIIPIIESLEKKDRDNSTSVLIVDDSQIVRTTLSYTFRKEGFTVWLADSGEKAIEILKEHKPQFITMDIQMDGLDGYETSKLIRNNPETQNIPIIMITSLDSVESRLKGFESGIAEYFTKPFEPMGLVKYVNNVTLKLDSKINKKVLLAERELETEHVVSYILKKHGFDVICEKNTQGIWDKFNKEDFDVIILDFDMGISTNYELIQRINMRKRVKKRHIPILVITSIENKYTIPESFKRGADDYISRPVIEQELIVRVLTHLSLKESMENKYKS